MGKYYEVYRLYLHGLGVLYSAFCSVDLLCKKKDYQIMTLIFPYSLGPQSHFSATPDHTILSNNSTCLSLC